MRKHLENCLEKEQFTMFPTNRGRGQIQIKAEINMPIYCNCRMSEIKPMIECCLWREWYHVGACASITPNQMMDMF